jgi:hypothetical protein
VTRHHIDHFLGRNDDGTSFFDLFVDFLKGFLTLNFFMTFSGRSYFAGFHTTVLAQMQNSCAPRL